MQRLITILTTIPDKKTAQLIANKLLQNKLAACVQISGPIESHYTWNNKKEISKEYQCTIKTQSHLYKKIEALISANHPYETPQIIGIPILNISQNYADWIRKETTIS
ncbi:MAG: divalent-cation tolerance protein CutA [Candidatus Margulisbacteria bacterium]|nr:divalent-cation tolerance protein CutA [Candidatus Margulisiibacteriota bacterium]